MLVLIRSTKTRLSNGGEPYACSVKLEQKGFKTNASERLARLTHIRLVISVPAGLQNEADENLFEPAKD